MIKMFRLSMKNGTRSSKAHKRGSNAVAHASYISGEKLLYKNEKEGIEKTFDYARKERILFSDVVLPEEAPADFKDPAKLWNAAEKAETQSNARVFKSFVLSLPRELNEEARKDVATKFAKSLADEGMCVQFAIHDQKNGNGNFHAHFICTTRKVNPDGTFQQKFKNGYKLDADGNKIPVLDKKGNQKIEKKTGRKLWEREKIDLTGWNGKEKVEEWRKRACDIINKSFEENGVEKKVDYRSYKRQGKAYIAGKHIGFKKDSNTEAKKEFNKYAKRHNMLIDENEELTKKYNDLESKITKLSIKQKELERKVQSNEYEINRIKRFARMRDNKRLKKGKNQRSYIEQLTKQYDMQRLSISKLGTPMQNQQRETDTTDLKNSNNNVLLSRESGNSDKYTREGRFISENALRPVRPTDQDRIVPSQPQSDANRQQLAPQSVPDRSLVASGDIVPAPAPASSPSPAPAPLPVRSASSSAAALPPTPTPTRSQEPKEKDSHFVKFAKQHIDNFAKATTPEEKTKAMKEFRKNLKYWEPTDKNKSWFKNDNETIKNYAISILGQDKTSEIFNFANAKKLPAISAPKHKSPVKKKNVAGIALGDIARERRVSYSGAINHSTHWESDSALARSAQQAQIDYLKSIGVDVSTDEE